MAKLKWTPEEKAKLEELRKEIDRYQNILTWQRIRKPDAR